VSVYVDDMKRRYGRMFMCHMIADSTAELHAMADRIGVARRWLQKAGTPREHYDVCLAMRAVAIEYGAIPITQRELAVKTRARRPLSPPIEAPNDR